MVTTAFETAVAAVRDGADPVGEAHALYDRLTDEERLGLLDGDTPFWEGMSQMMLEGYNLRPYVHGEVPRLGIPGTRFVDGPRGCVAGQGTAFPVSMARGATWDVELEERVGEAIGREIRAQGGNFFGGVCINLPRHPAWGRAQETYGDDPHHLGELGAALTRGTQRWVMACAKHYALNSMENARFTVDVTADEATLHEVYLPHFKRVADEGVAAIMSAYNAVNGQWCGQHPYLLTTVLRDMWGWQGVTVSDFIWGLRDAAASLEAGLDLEEPLRQQRERDLPGALADGRTTWDAVARSGVRLLAAQLRSYATRTPDDPDAAVMACPEHRDLAREVGARAMVLLRNEPVDGAPVLPLDPGVASIAVLGRLATAPNLGDAGSSNVRAPGHVTPADGLRAAFPDARLEVVDTDDPQAAAAAAARAEVAVVVVGFTRDDEGEYVGGDAMADPALTALYPPMPDGMEDPMTSPDNVFVAGGTAIGGDRSRLTLRPVDEDLVQAVAAANPRTVVAVVAAGTVLMEAWREQVPAVLMMWYAGMAGGHALADVLTGAHNPSGRLPFAIPTSEEHLPPFDRDATAVTYDRYHGQRLLDRLGVEAAYPHGYGLSYTTYRTEAARATRDGDRVSVTATVANTGDRAGHHVVQVYGRRDGEPGVALVGFATVRLAAGATAEVTLPVSLDPLGRWDPDQRRVVPPAGPVTLEVGGHAHDPEAVVVTAG